ncbi:DEAD/DEAH box helicase [Arcticibacter tournemirensis]
MRDLIPNIIAGKGIDEIFSYVQNNLYKQGPISVTDLEIISYLALYQPEAFKVHQDAILNYMAVFYKETGRNTLKDVIFGQYKRFIQDTYQHKFTPVQADIAKSIGKNNCFSFSAPTSTGKSFVFINKLKECNADAVVVVPSRALINEYYLRLSNDIPEHSVNILTFIDKINTNAVKKNIFIVTPERCRELFRQKELFNIQLFLFDEAQLSNEDSKRGIYFDSIVRRCQKAFPAAKFVFAHPFVQNPGAQIEKNHFVQETSHALQYRQKNVGQLFLCKGKGEDNRYYHFGIDQAIMGKKRYAADFDPVANAIQHQGTVLFYVSKTKIYNQQFLTKFKRYVDLCPVTNDPAIDQYINQLKKYTGGETGRGEDHYSLMLDLLRRGIVIHHGSLPLQTRMVIEQFTRAGHCRICFATSTLEQGINMPFEVVYLDRIEHSKSLSVKNLIGRAGRSSQDNKFDFGCVIVNSPDRIAAFRKIMTTDEVLDTVSALERSDLDDEEMNEFRQAILDGTYSDEFNLTDNEERLVSVNVETVIRDILNAMFNGNVLVPFVQINDALERRLLLFQNFEQLYTAYLGRPLVDGESNVLNTAFKIIFWKVHGKTFKNICWYRYAYASQSTLREKQRKAGLSTESITANFITGYNDIPDKNLKVFSLFPRGTKASAVQYDLIMYDTYDYIDKLIGFKLSDIYYAALMKYADKFHDERAVKLAKLIKFGTDNDRFIWMLRYGLSFEDIENLDEHIEDIGEEAIIFRPSIDSVAADEKEAVKRFMNEN